MIAQVQKAWSSSQVRSCRLPRGSLGPGQHAWLAGRGPGEVCPADGERAAGRACGGGRQRLGGAGVVLGGGADQHRQDGQTLAGARVHPRFAAPVFLAGVDIGLADRAGRGPRPPPGRVLGRPAGQVQVEGANREQGMPAGQPWRLRPACCRGGKRVVLVRSRCFHAVGDLAAAGSGCRCRGGGAQGRPRSYGRAAGPGCPGCGGPGRAGVLAGSRPAGYGPGGRTAGSGRSARPGCAARWSAAGPARLARAGRRHRTAAAAATRWRCSRRAGCGLPARRRAVPGSPRRSRRRACRPWLR